MFQLKKLAILIVVTCMALGACQPAPSGTPETVEVQVTTIVEQQVVVTAAPGAPAGENPYAPTELLAAVQAIKDATAGQSPPAGAKFAILTNNLSPFWTAAQQGASRASAELGVPITFQGPTAADLLSQQLTMLETFINDDYTSITFSAIDRQAAGSIIQRAVDEGISVFCMDSDATGTARSMYIGMSDYDAGVAAAEAALEIIGSGKVVGLVGFATAQNAQDRIAGVTDTRAGTDLEMVEVLYDDVKPEVALSNAQTAIQKYPDLAGFITFYSYDGPAAGQAVKQAGKAGEIKIVAFDAEPETQRLMQEGVIQVMIGQRVFHYGYLSGYVMYASSILGVEETLKLLEPWRDGEGNFRLNTGIDVIYADSFDLYKEYLNSIGIPSQ
ncbi:MAG: substrate-binding domain-containing protein [Anaerolineales bacterium]|nr:substrate-binding domain-containing protein [Anaerolineales bacterium]